MRRKLHKKGFLDEIVDDIYAGLFLFLAFLIAFLAFSIGQKDSLVEYKTTIGEAYNERTLNLYFKYPLWEEAQLVDFVNQEEAAAETIPLIAKPYFDDYFGELNWWVLEINFPNEEREDIRITSSGSRSSQETAATLLLPSEEGIITVVLFEDRFVDIIMAVSPNPVMGLYYWIFG